jgi:hypothetical protein
MTYISFVCGIKQDRCSNVPDSVRRSSSRGTILLVGFGAGQESRILPDKDDTSIEVSGRKCGMGRDETSECLLAEKRSVWLPDVEKCAKPARARKNSKGRTARERFNDGVRVCTQRRQAELIQSDSEGDHQETRSLRGQNQEPGYSTAEEILGHVEWDLREEYITKDELDRSEVVQKRRQ